MAYRVESISAGLALQGSILNPTLHQVSLSQILSLGLHGSSSE